MIDTAEIKRQNDLLTLAEKYTDLRGNGNERYGACPKCGGTDRFHLKGQSFFCRKCHPEWGDVIEFACWLNGFSFAEACDWLTNGNTPQQNGLHTSQHRIHAPKGVNVGAESPEADWQDKARRVVVDRLTAAIFEPEQQQARQWLHWRGIDDVAIARYSLGYTTGGNVGDLWFGLKNAEGKSRPERGIVIPHWYEAEKIMFALKVRRPVAPGTPNKYFCAAGSRPAASLFNADSLIGNDICFVTEGEFDAIALHAAIGDKAAVITLGSKTAHIGARWLSSLLHVKRFYIVTDANEDDAAAKYWLDLVGNRGRRVVPPGGYKDVCEAAEAGVDLIGWANYEI